MVDTPGLLSSRELREWSSRLAGERVIYFPVRHHSPGCARHLRRLIAERRPSLVLVEGPSDFDKYVDLLSHADARPPLALYSYCTERGDDKRRRGAYYPFCEYSPEWVAIRDGRAAGAEVRFIDLTFTQQLAVDQTERLAGRLATLLEEKHFERSAYLRQLAADRGCRSQDELWDRLFEAWSERTSTEEFIAQIAAYCRLSRTDVSEAEHEHDGTAAREQEMAWHIAKALKDKSRAQQGPILVVTGGYHTVVLPDLVASATKRPKIDTSASAEPGSVMIRYSFDRLDRMNGYGAGMPQPAFYQRVWAAAGASEDIALEVISDVAIKARQQSLDIAPSTASLGAAYEQVQRLAQLRGNPSPTRTDILDAIGSCFAKGPMDADGGAVMALALRLMSGSAVGSVPKEAGLPSIVEDFQREVRGLRLRVSDTEVRTLNLDVYRDERDRRVSRLFHVLQYLEVPFAAQLSGPQFTARHVGRRLLEVWEYGWSPQTESALIDASIYGNSLREAAGARFTEALQSADTVGENRSAAIAARFLSQACLLGLHELAARILVWLRRCVREDPSIISLSQGLLQLVLLWESRDPLGAEGLDSVPELARSCMERACFLMAELPKTAPADAPSTVDALMDLRQALIGSEHEWFDAEIFWTALAPLPVQQPCEPMIAGAAAGALYSIGRWSEAQLAAAFVGRMTGRKDGKAATAFFRGMAVAAREALWQADGVFAALREIVENVDDGEFMRLLPELRMAFAGLAPRETDRLAAVVARALGTDTLGSLVNYQVSEALVARNLQLSEQIAAILRRDGLADWLPADSQDPRA
ncbi:MAG TPA: DUF5682 family protein [Steroidobacteraceae bacterium]|nr:DUF5682 family protein [Steroidobacteraceae bacterium]